MGAPKALLDAGGESFLARIVAAQREGGCRPVIVVIPEEGRLEAAVRTTGAEVAWNREPSAGPITSMRAGLGVLEGRNPTGLLWHPVDFPLVPAPTIRALLDAALATFDAAREDAHALVVPRYSGRSGHPVVIGASLFPDLLDTQLRGGVRTVTRRHEDRRLYFDTQCAGVLQGIDTPEQYRALFG